MTRLSSFACPIGCLHGCPKRTSKRRWSDRLTSILRPSSPRASFSNDACCCCACSADAIANGSSIPCHSSSLGDQTRAKHANIIACNFWHSRILAGPSTPPPGASGRIPMDKLAQKFPVSVRLGFGTWMESAVSCQ